MDILYYYRKTTVHKIFSGLNKRQLCDIIDIYIMSNNYNFKSLVTIYHDYCKISYNNK